MQQHQPLQATPGGTYQHMHDVLDGLSPQDCMPAIEHEFPGSHPHLTDLGVWAEIPGTNFGITEPNPERMWEVLAAEVHRRHTRALVTAANVAGTVTA